MRSLRSNVDVYEARGKELMEGFIRRRGGHSLVSFEYLCKV